MYCDIENLIGIHEEIGVILQELAQYEDGLNCDYSSVTDDLKWNRYMLKDRLNALKLKKDLNE